jgi:16S rRNA (adenine1518-N6/adenine1519-N6)-dimethyltransferase
MRSLRDALEARGVTPQKRHGQCFLTDAQAVDAIVRDAGVGPADSVIEVGTGTGLLTHVLAETGAAVDTFDIDGSIQEVARSLRSWPERVRFHVGDVLASKHALSDALLSALAAARERVGVAGPGRVRFVSNLPYNAATPVILSLLALSDPPDDVTVMVQLELAEKLLAGPGERDYGPPSILRALEADGRILRRFPPQVFWPPPRVTSAVVRLVPRRPRELPVAEERDFASFLLAVFSRRRKILSTGLRVARPRLAGAAATSACAAAGLDPALRPEDAPPEALLALFRGTRR